jgi:hypothetical protein
MYVNVSIMPTAQYIGVVARRPRSSPFVSGRALKMMATAMGNRRNRAHMEKFQIFPQ